MYPKGKRKISFYEFLVTTAAHHFASTNIWLNICSTSKWTAPTPFSEKKKNRKVDFFKGSELKTWNLLLTASINSKESSQNEKKKSLPHIFNIPWWDRVRLISVRNFNTKKKNRRPAGTSKYKQSSCVSLHQDGKFLFRWKFMSGKRLSKDTILATIWKLACLPYHL